jgi:PAS domain S-box-containing protein
MQYTLFIILAPMAAILLIGVLTYSRFYRPSPKNSSLIWLMITTLGWLIFNTLELADPSEAGTVAWAKVSYIFIPFAPTTFLAFALQYTGRRTWLKPSRIGILCIIPAITTLLAWTNNLHGLLWRGYNFVPVNGMLAMEVDHGPWFWVQLFYAYTQVLLGSILILRQSFSSFSVYRMQSLWLATGALVPILTNIVYNFRLIPGFRKDYTPISFALASLAFSIGILRYRLFDLKPIARDAMVASMSDPMLALDMQDRIVDMNPAAQSLIRIKASQAIGQPTGSVLNPWRKLVERYRNETNVQTEIELERNGVKSVYDLRISSLTDQKGAQTGRLLILRDITANKQAEAELRRYAAELEERNEELDAFAHTVAHDLKTPLGSLIGYSHLLRSSLGDTPDVEVNEVLDTIIKSADRMTNIINELLILARVRKQQDVPATPLDMGVIITNALERLRNLADECHAEIHTPSTWPTALGYTPWIEEVWANYIDNALKHGGSPPRLELGANPQLDGEFPMIRFWVRDNGPGIPAENQARLFTPFTRLDQARAQGHGLGLSIVNRIIERLGGEAGVESKEGEGSIFWFTLPSAKT